MEKGLQDILGGAQAIAERAERERQTSRDAAKAEILDMQRQILAGEGSTGNPLHDGIIALYGELVHPGLVKKYETIADQLETIPLYEPVVLIRQWLEDAEHICFGGDGRQPRQSLKKHTTMGTLKSRQIQFDYSKKQAFIPTAQHSPMSEWPKVDDSHKNDLLIDGRMGYREPNLGYELNRALDLNVPMFIRPMQDGPINAMEILIGYKGIQEWLAERGEYDDDRVGDLYTMRSLAKELQIKTIEPATEWQRTRLERRL